MSRLVTTLLAALALLLLAACGADDDQPRQEPAAVTIEHKFGTTEVPAAPERVVAVGFNDQDFALALDVVPAAARQFQGGIDVMRRPWAQEALGGATPAVVGAEEIDFEKVAAARPDVILGVYSGMTKQDYATLSKIAPTIAQSDEFVDFGEPWQQQLQTTGRALGKAAEAKRVRADVDAAFAEARRENPQLEGATLAFAAGSADGWYVYAAQDLRVRFFTDLGMTTPPGVAQLVGDKFFAELSRERLELLDADVLVAYGDGAELSKDAAFRRLKAVREGRVVFLPVDGDVANALGFSSPLSLPFALDEMVPRLTAAIDGDVATEVRPIPGA
jgi:iron complex transport system substrate-binding protein